MNLTTLLPPLIAAALDALESDPTLLARVREALAPDAAPELLDRSGVARALGTSPGGIDRLRREGLPHLFVGASPRFRLGECLAWLAARHAADEAEPAPSRH